MKRYSIVFLAAALLSNVSDAATDPVDATCLVGADPTTETGSALDTFTVDKAGVLYDGNAARLQLQKQGGVFSGTVLGVSDKIFAGCSADFNEDGWADFVGTGSTTNSYIKFYKNETYQNPAPANWSDPTQIRTPKFSTVTQIEAPNSTYDAAVMGCADLDGDGHKDFVYLRCNASGSCTPIRTDIFLGKGDGTFKTPYKMVAAGNESRVGPVGWTSGSIAFVDYNKDGKLDIVLGTSAGTGGALKVLINDGASPPRFDQEVYLQQNMGYGVRGAGAVAVADFTGDGVPDYVVASPSSTQLRLFPGLLGGGVGTFQNLYTAAYAGGGTSILVGDFSLSGKLGMLVGSDSASSSYPGGRVYTYENNGSSTPFSGGIKQTINTGSSDLDMGWGFDYDHDPDGTIDFVMADGNNSSSYYLFANRTLQKYVTCGTVASAAVDLGPLSTTEMTVTSVRLAPVPATPNAADGTVTWEASNDDGGSWHPALTCADDPTKFCSSLTTTNGSKVRWRATMCSNTTAPANTRTPYITSVATSFSYVTAQNHFRAGPVARDGLIYVGAFRMPGNSGHFYAMNDATGATMWDAATVMNLTASTDRHVYTVTPTGTRTDVSIANASSTDLKAALLTSDTPSTSALVSWFLSARFGLYAPLNVMGSIENSTPALLTPPTRPYWYDYLTTPASERTALDVYLNAYKNRTQLAFVGSRDGSLHAFYTNPASAIDTWNGKEVWGFVPGDVAQRLGANKAVGTANAYPDGSPTLVSAKVNGAWRTVLVSGEANGGTAVFALDVTDTVSSGGVTGPTPLWQFQDANMGRSYSKPTVIRVKVGTQEKWMAVFGSGAGASSDLGDSVYAVDVSTGALLWRFDLNDTNAYISTDITASETNDEAGTAIDGYIDRVFFADNKGRMWKLDPGAYDASTHTIASVGSTKNVGLANLALFSTLSTTGALGQERAIGGTLTTATDSSNKLVLYFGTGGTEDTSDLVQNAFYAIYADSGVIRNKLDFATGVLVGVKFYGGVIYNAGQIVFTSGRDFGVRGLCSATAGNVIAIDANTFEQQFSTPTSSKIVAPVFARGGEIYTVTLTGQLVTSSYQSTSTAPPAAGVATGPYSEAKEWGASNDPMKVTGWRQMY